jgi:hypothetical protein
MSTSGITSQTRQDNCLRLVADAGLPDGTYVFKPKIQIWVNFGGSCNGICWYILWTFGLFYGHLIYFMPIRNIFMNFWYIFPRFGISTKKNLATLLMNLCSHRFESSEKKFVCTLLL